MKKNNNRCYENNSMNNQTRAEDFTIFKLFESYIETLIRKVGRKSKFP